MVLELPAFIPAIAQVCWMCSSRKLSFGFWFRYKPFSYVRRHTRTNHGDCTFGFQFYNLFELLRLSYINCPFGLYLFILVLLASQYG